MMIERTTSLPAVIQLYEPLRLFAADETSPTLCLQSFFCQLSPPRARRSSSRLSRHPCLGLPLLCRQVKENKDTNTKSSRCLPWYNKIIFTLPLTDSCIS